MNYQALNNVHRMVLQFWHLNEGDLVKEDWNTK